MQSRTMVVAVALVAVVGVTGASAFTTATVARDAQISVQNDASSVIKLQDGSVEGAQVTSGTLEINGEDSEASLNREALFRFGDNSSASAAETDHAFTLTNADDKSHTFEFELTSAPGVTIELYDKDGNVATIENGKSPVSTTVSSETTLYAVVIVDTGTATGDNAIDGTLTITASSSSSS